jgi:hypothetical protein
MTVSYGWPPSIEGFQGADERDVKPVFPDRPNAILFVADSLPVLPALTAPFTKASVSNVLGAMGLDVRVSEEAAGRWTRALERARLDGRAERRER